MLLCQSTPSHGDIPPDVRRLAERLEAIHGKADIRKESGGFQIYVASPACLEKDGRRELDKKHLAFNTDPGCRQVSDARPGTSSALKTSSILSISAVISGACGLSFAMLRIFFKVRRISEIEDGIGAGPAGTPG